MITNSLQDLPLGKKGVVREDSVSFLVAKLFDPFTIYHSRADGGKGREWEEFEKDLQGRFSEADRIMKRRTFVRPEARPTREKRPCDESVSVPYSGLSIR